MELANELLIKIFNYLSFDDLMSVKEVDDNFMLLVQDVIKSSKIVLINERLQNSVFVHQLFDSGVIIDFEDCLIGKSFINFHINQKIHHKINKLILLDPNKLSNLIGFHNLVYLEIILTSYTDKRNETILKMDNLRAFSFVNRKGSSLNFILDLPKLRCLKVNVSLINFKFMYPNTIEELSCINNHSIEQFENLRIINCISLDIYGELTGIRQFKFLEKFHFLSLSARTNQNSVNQFFETDNENLVVSYKSFNLIAEPLSNPLILNISMKNLNDFNLEIYDRHLNQLVHPLVQTELKIENLDERSLDILRKLVYLETLIITGEINNENKWISILTSRFLTDLQLKCRINQNLLEIIPLFCKHLTKLEIRYFDGIPNWIFELTNLTTLVSNFFFEFKLLKLLLIKLKKLKHIKIVFCNFEISTDRVMCRFNYEDSFYLDEDKQVFIQILDSVNEWSKIFELG